MSTSFSLQRYTEFEFLCQWVNFPNLSPALLTPVMTFSVNREGKSVRGSVSSGLSVNLFSYFVRFFGRTSAEWIRLCDPPPPGRAKHKRIDTYCLGRFHWPAPTLFCSPDPRWWLEFPKDGKNSPQNTSELQAKASSVYTDEFSPFLSGRKLTKYFRIFFSCLHYYVLNNVFFLSFTQNNWQHIGFDTFWPSAALGVVESVRLGWFAWLVLSFGDSVVHFRPTENGVSPFRMQRFYPLNTNKNAPTLKVPSNTLGTRDFSLARLWSSSRPFIGKRERVQKNTSLQENTPL